MLKLIVFPGPRGKLNPSSFCAKAEVLLKMSGVPYEIERAADPGVGPTKKLPAIRDGDELIGDSELIRRHLEQRYGADFDAGLTQEQKAIAHAFARMCEERLYWVLVYSRWIEDAGWQHVKEAFFGGMAAPIRALVAPLARRSVRASLHGHGIGRHTRDNLYAFGVADVRAIATHLGDQPFFMGEMPTSVDATVYPLIALTVASAVATPVREEVARHTNLAAYVARMNARYFP